MTAPDTQSDTNTGGEMIMGEYRNATVADVMARMQAVPRHETYSVDAMGWGLGDAGNNVELAVQEAERLGLVTVKRSNYSGQLTASLTDAGQTWQPEKPPLPQRVPGQSLTDGYAQAAEMRLKAQRLEELHEWMQARYLFAVRRRDIDKQRSHAGTLFFIETGHNPLKHGDECAEFERRLFDAARDTLDMEYAKCREESLRGLHSDPSEPVSVL